jgi:hypothetical protein
MIIELFDVAIEEEAHLPDHELIKVECLISV